MSTIFSQRILNKKLLLIIILKNNFNSKFKLEQLTIYYLVYITKVMQKCYNKHFSKSVMASYLYTKIDKKFYT